MTDFAANIIAALTASSGDRAASAKMIVSEVDTNGDGKLTGGEFQKVFAVLQRTEQIAGSRGSTQSTGFTSAGVRPTIFDCTLYPSFSTNYALSQYQAVEMFSSFDKNNDKVITEDELSGTATTPSTPATTPATDAAATTPTDGAAGSGSSNSSSDSTSGTTTTPDQPQQTPAERADALMALYDTTNKGYVTLEDIAGAWIKDPTLGDVSQLANIVQAWDSNGDGKITKQEITSIFTIMDTADSMLAQMGEAAQDGTSAERTITLANVTDEQLAQIEASRDTLTSWDADKDGALTRTELIDGLRALNQQAAPTPTAADYGQAMLTSFDADKNGALSLDEFEQAVATDMDATAAKSSFDAWDTNQDGSISIDELTSGVDAAQRATQIMATYDIANKGYFDIADLQRVLDESPDKNTRASAAEIMAVWDLDGDGHVTTQEVVNQLLLQKEAQSSATSPASDTSLSTG